MPLPNTIPLSQRLLRRVTVSIVLYVLLSCLAEPLVKLISIFAQRPQDSKSDVDELTDEGILQRFKTAPEIDCSVRRLTPRTIAKATIEPGNPPNSSEANALNMVHAQTTIPVPRVRRVIKEEWSFVIVMDYIEGLTLAEAWPNLSLWKKFSIILILRSYISQLHRLQATPQTPPGPVCKHTGEPARKCVSPLFGKTRPKRGPFASYNELSEFFNRQARIGLSHFGVSNNNPLRNELFDDTAPLVLTHSDINPRNLILGSEGRLWMIDWGWSGFYPPWFEYMSMREQAENEILNGFQDRLWELAIPFCCGIYFRQEQWMARTGPALSFHK
ncbi:kinase-like domain-containing protein [Lentinula edodes]|nr:kinase-like domain-containing protein [Lentinula edodes]